MRISALIGALAVSLGSITAEAQGGSGDAKGPIALLQTSVKCPLKASEIKRSDGSKISGISTHSFNGDKKRFSLETKVKGYLLSPGENYKNDLHVKRIASASRLRAATVKGHDVRVSCQSNDKCFDVTVITNPNSIKCDDDFCEAGMRSDEKSRRNWIEFRLCDAQTATDAADAINELIRLNKGL